MNYSKIYNAIIGQSKKVKNHDESLERHLVVPNGVWGAPGEVESNVVWLTARQRLVAYLLLRKMYPASTSIATTTKALLKARGKKKRRVPAKRKPHTLQTRQKMSASHTGKRFSVDSRQKMSLAKKGKPQTAEHIHNKIAARRNNEHWFSSEARHNMSLAAKNRRPTQKKSQWSIATQ